MKGNGISSMMDFDLLRIGFIKKMVKSRWFQPVLIWINLAVFVVFIMAGLFGSPIGNRNAAIVLIWIFWFFLLVAFLIPIGGRAWCMMCPLPAPAEWIQRRSLVNKYGEPRSLGIKWPRRLDNIWLQNLGFLAVAGFSPIIFYYPAATAIALLTFMVLAVITGLVFVSRGRVGRVFCRYICPLGGFIGLYSLLGAVEVKHRNHGICKTCKFKKCIKGSPKGYSCPWFQYPGGMKRNAYCGLCTECIKTCAYDNMTFKTRFFGVDLLKKRKMDEAYKSFIMLGSVFVYSAVYFAWFGELKDVSQVIQGLFISDPWRLDRLMWFILLLLGSTLFLMPTLHCAFTWLARKLAGATDKSLKELFVDYAYALVPLGMAGWIGFMLYMIMINGSYIVALVSDPLGWGWDLLGTADYAWRPYFTGLLPYLLLAIFLGGAVLATYVGWRISLENFSSRRRAFRAMMPITSFIIVLSSGFVYLYVMP